MSFTLDSSVPADSETPRNGASRIRSLTSEVVQLFGETGASPVTYALAPIASVDHSTGLATVQGVPTTSLGIATKGYVDASTPSNVFVGSAAGTNIITTTLAPVPANQAALAGFVIHLRITTTNTGAVTLNPNGFGALAIVKNGNNALTGGELVAGKWVDLVYDITNTNYQIIDTLYPSTIVVYRTNDQSVTSSTTLTNDNTLLFSIAANEVWTASIIAYVTMSTAGGLDVSFTVPSGATTFFGQHGGFNTTSGSRLSIVAGSSGSPNLFNFYINVINGSTPGTVQFQFSQDVSDGTATIMKAGSSLVATKLN